MEGGCLLNYLRESAWKANYKTDICVSWALQIAQVDDRISIYRRQLTAVAVPPC